MDNSQPVAALAPDWAAVRDRIHLDPTVTMLNAGSFGPLPKPVFERVTELRRRLAAGPTDFFLRQAPPLLWESRERISTFLGARPERFIFTANVSAAINLIASGLKLDAPGEILMTDHEYGAMVWCWERAGQRQGLSVRTFPLPAKADDPDEVVAAAKRAMTPQTRLLYFSHVISSTGWVLPAKELCDLARQHGITTVIDGAHAPAMIPLAIDDVGADFYTGNLHKWLLAPTGTGFLALRPGNEGRLQPLQVSWGYYPDAYPIGEPARSAGPDSRDAYGSTPRIRFLEFEGTRDICPWLAVPEAIDFQASLGWEAVRGRARDLGGFARRVLGGIGLPEATPPGPGSSGSMTAFALPAAVDIVRLRRELWNQRIEIPVIERPDRFLLRLSHPFFTTESEIETLAGALRSIL